MSRANSALAAARKRCPCALLLGLALVSGCVVHDDSPTQPSPTTPGTPIYYTAVGASEAVGIGATTPCVPFSACPDGTGYVPTIARRLGADGTPVTLTNLGIPAAVIGADFQALGIQFGRTIPGNFIENEMPFVPRNSTHITVFAGGNDVNTIIAAVGGGAGGSDPAAYADAQIRAFGNEYTTLIRGLKERAPSARIIVANLPNFAGLPFTASYSLERKQLAQKLSVGFGIQAINTLTSQGIPVVDLLCNPQSYQAAIYSSDGFHPNDAGYAYIAGELLTALTSSGYAAPQGSCPEMTLVAPR